MPAGTGLAYCVRLVLPEAPHFKDKGANAFQWEHYQ